MKNFDVQALLTQIENTVVPELPEDHHPNKLETYVAAVLAQLILASESERIDLMKMAIPEAQRVNSQMFEFTTYLGDITKEKFASFSEEQRIALQQLNTLVQRSAGIAHVYARTLLIVGGGA